MIRNYCKIAFRSFTSNKVSSFINVFGLATGMAVTILIGLWVWDEYTYDHYHQNHERIAQVWQEVNTKQYGIGDYSGAPIPLAAELRRSYSDVFKRVSLTNSCTFLIATGETKQTQSGMFMEPDAPDMLTLKMVSGTRGGLKDPNSIMFSESTARKIFGVEDPVGKLVKLNNSYTVKVTGVYEDLPYNTSYREVSYIAPWEFFISNFDWIKQYKDSWESGSGIIVELAPYADAASVSKRIENIKEAKSPNKDYTSRLFLYPMDRWHLHSQFTDGVEKGGLIVYVRLFAAIGIFVLLLACINFMNLSTARSEKRAREVGIRKTVGSGRWQLIGQFYCESILITLLAFVISILFIQLLLPWFNDVADKKLSIPWSSAAFWLTGIAFSCLTGVVAGSYPALYLSSFRPIKVLKGVFKAGRFAALPRKVLVVLQFSISVLLITGTIIVFRQIQFAKDRPVGYDRSRLISIQERTPDIYQNYEVIRQELLRQNLIVDMAESQCPVTDIWAGGDGFTWKGKKADQANSFAIITTRHEYGKTLGWTITAGRDFSRAFATDSNGVIMNETAVAYTGLKNPVGEIINYRGKNLKVLGVVKDIVMASPYEPIPPTVYMILHEGGNFINIRLNPALSAGTSLKKMEAVFRQYDPNAPFNYTFIDQDYARKFGAEERIGKLASFFATLAVLISSLGLFGLASFVATQRIREIGIRKVLGATVFNLWQLLSMDFVKLIIISILIATPIAWYLMNGWLQHYKYRSGMPWWIFVLTGMGAIVLTLATVSFQAIKAALINPTRSLRTE